MSYLVHTDPKRTEYSLQIKHNRREMKNITN
jgi:hypothetical protein